MLSRVGPKKYIYISFSGVLVANEDRIRTFIIQSEFIFRMYDLGGIFSTAHRSRYLLEYRCAFFHVMQGTDKVTKSTVGFYLSFA